jgi:excisionase family DNA binding protein
MNEQDTLTSDFLTKGEAAVILRVSEVTISRLIAAGKLAAYKVGRRVFTTRQAINDYLQGSEGRPEAA